MAQACSKVCLQHLSPQFARSPAFRDFPSCAAIELNRSFVSHVLDRGVVTENTLLRQEIGGEGIHLHDSYVWTEIYYLDSPSDYGEYLQQDRYWSPDGHSLEMMDSPQQSLRPAKESFGLAGSCFLPVRRPDRMSALLPGSAVKGIAREGD